MNEIIEYDDYAEIILYDRHGNEKARAIIDLDDVDKCKYYRWSYDSTGAGYVKCRSENIRLHRFIMDAPNNLYVDHINHNGLDNRKSNLRICTKQENDFNKQTLRRNTSGYPGVSQLPNGKWRAYITFNRRQICLGRFSDIEDAIRARRQAEIDYFGSYSPNNNSEGPII